MVHHCQRADFKESSKLARGPNRNQACQPYETFCTLTRHPNTTLGPKKLKQAPPKKKDSFSENVMKEYEKFLNRCNLFSCNLFIEADGTLTLYTGRRPNKQSSCIRGDVREVGPCIVELTVHLYTIILVLYTFGTTWYNSAPHV